MKTKHVIAAPSAVDDPGREAWLVDRRSGIGGSDIAGIMGLSPWGSPLQVWESKIGRYSLPDTEKMAWGRLLEREIVAEAVRRLGGTLLPVPSTIRHRAYPYFMASLDAMIDVNGEPCVLECKTTSEHAAAEWERNGPPDHYLAQVQWYLMVSGLATGYIATLFGGQRMLIWEVSEDREWQQKAICAGVEFWKLVSSRTPPPATENDDAVLSGPGDDAIPPLEVSGELEILLDDYYRLQQECSGLDKRRRATGNRIRQIMGAATRAEGRGFTVTYVAQKGRAVLDEASLRRDHHEIADQYTTTIVGARVLRCRKVKHE
jgi:putative phage-type endonuclease